GLGSDLGGPPALVAGFALLTLRVAGVTLTWRRVATVLGGAAAVVLTFALADWLRPEDERTHLGRFVEQVLAGELADVVWRKAGAALTTLGVASPVLAGALLAGVVVLGVRRRRRTRPQDAADAATTGDEPG